MTSEELNEESEISVVLRTLFDNNVQPPNHIKNAIDEMIQLQSVHDLVCIKLDLMRKTTTEEIMKFFLEWKMTNS